MQHTRPHTRFVILSAAALLLSGCVSTIAHVVTAPVRLADKAVDWSTTSQSESDRNRGRDIRRREERLGKVETAYQGSLRACRNGDRAACDRARAQYGEMQAIMPTVPYEPR